MARLIRVDSFSQPTQRNLNQFVQSRSLKSAKDLHLLSEIQIIVKSAGLLYHQDIKLSFLQKPLCLTTKSKLRSETRGRPYHELMLCVQI